MDALPRDYEAIDSRQAPGACGRRGRCPGSLPSVPAVPVEVPEEVRTPTAAIPLATPALPEPPKPGSQDVDDAPVTGMRVPSMALTVTQWASLWVRMCSDGESVLGPLNDDNARARYGLTAKQLRNVRHAATSGALRQKAIMLGVELPPGYVDNPADDRVNGRLVSVVAMGEISE